MPGTAVSCSVMRQLIWGVSKHSTVGRGGASGGASLVSNNTVAEKAPLPQHSLVAATEKLWRVPGSSPAYTNCDEPPRLFGWTGNVLGTPSTMSV